MTGGRQDEDEDEDESEDEDEDEEALPGPFSMTAAREGNQ